MKWYIYPKVIKVCNSTVLQELGYITALKCAVGLSKDLLGGKPFGSPHL